MMLEKRLISEADGQASAKKIVMFKDVKLMRILANPVAWRIMELLSRGPAYPAQVAKELKIYEQSAYYYIRKLVSIGAVEEVGKNFVRGGTARLYQATSPSFGIEMGWGETRLAPQSISKNKSALKFFEGYVAGSSFHGLMVVGAPDPHGPYKAAARDGHYAVHLAFFLGNITNAVPSEFVVKLDVDAKAEKMLTGNNLISIGGPGTNIVTAEFNRYLPIRFDEKNFWSGLVDNSGKRYSLDNHGLIAKIRNPYDSNSGVMVVAGVRSAGTKSAVIALTNYGEEVLKKYNGEEDWALVVQGFDMNSDGKIDHVDIVSGL
ncbi:MAG TPA: helix-turn-helix domain-containing protein [Nitrososphaera sp.]|jgi:helix-turn-helix protein|nr:helix-turn-helix domain-containing protein [Nitrososphaera sp.]